MEDLKEIHSWIQNELESCIAFWLKNGMDKVSGGIYTCLDRTGRVYSSDKSVWMQGRAAWTFAELCLVYGRKREWEEAAASCLRFLEEHCVNHEAGGRLYFTVTGDGKPLRQRRYWHSEDFYIMGNAVYGFLTGERVYIERARVYYEMVYKLNRGLMADPSGLPPKTIQETRKTRGLAKAMMSLNISGILETCDPGNRDLYRHRAIENAGEIIKSHFKPDLGCTLESVGHEGEFYRDSGETRIVNPGHDIECSWFMLDLAIRTGDAGLKETARKMFDLALEKGWDWEYGGLFSFIDALGLPVETYEHDMKFWWTHTELIIGSLKIYVETRDKKYLDWFIKAVNYCREHFSDPEHGEWYGYLSRNGAPTTGMVKGTIYKGPFHLPRMLMIADDLLTTLLR
jgi:N-acylglucosamine 2-epimerase